MPRPKAQYSVSKNQIQLALALSSSLEESNRRELLELTEELPASTIENGIVPQNIKQMQKKFLEELQMPQPGPTKKLKKPPKPVPTLTTRSSEERLRIITEKVALVLIKEDSFPCSVDEEINLKQLQDDGKVKYSSDQDHRANNHLLSSPDEPLHTSSNLLCHSRESQIIDLQSEALINIQNNWQMMLHNSILSDIVIVVMEKVKIQAHKLVLFVQCPSMICGLTSNENVIHWETIPHVQALAFLEFIYCGKLTSILALGDNVNGVVFLARKYEVMELLTFLLNRNISSGASSPDNGDLLNQNLCNKHDVDCGTVSPDIFADSEKPETSCELQITTETTRGKSQVGSKQVFDAAFQQCERSIEISSDGEDELVKNFFGTYNPLTIGTLENKVIDLTLDEELIEVINRIEETNRSFSVRASPLNSEASSHSLASTNRSRRSLLEAPTKNSHDNQLQFLKGKQVEDFSPISSPSSSKGKQSYSDNSDGNRSLTKRLGSSHSLASADSPKSLLLIPTNTSHYDNELQFLKRKHVEDFSPISSPLSSKGKQSYSDNSDDGSSLTKRFCSLSEKTPSPHKVSSLQTSLRQTPESKSKQITALRLAQLRTPLENVKSSSPVTPVPDYDVMTNEEFEAELLKFGLKKNMSRSKGIKMLKHIYEKLHPLVEVVSIDGKELLIPLSEKTPTAKKLYLPSCSSALDDVHESDEGQSDHELLSQQSNGSSGGDDMLEETVLEGDDDVSQGVTSNDLKKAVHAWITSQPEIHEMILCYEPIWLDSCLDDIKKKFKTDIKVNQLMDILDEEGITFRVAQGQRNVKRKKQSTPKKKLTTKSKQVNPKAMQSSSQTDMPSP